jgi:hypothetical protein
MCIYIYTYIFNLGLFLTPEVFPQPFRFLDHIQLTHTVGLLWTSGQPVAEASTYTGQHNIETQETNIHALSGIRTCDPSNQAAADLRLRPRGHRGRLSLYPLKTKLVWMLFKNSVRTSKRTPHFTITNINWVMVFKELIAVYSENHTEPINIKWKCYLMLKQLVYIATIRL